MIMRLIATKLQLLLSKLTNPPPSPFPTLEICADVVQPHVLGLRVGTLANVGQVSDIYKC